MVSEGGTIVIHRSTYTSPRTSPKRDRWSLTAAKDSTGSYITGKWHRPPSRDATPRFTCGWHIVAALLVLIFGGATTAAVTRGS
jgi:hypothetical protein